MRLTVNTTIYSPVKWLTLGWIAGIWFLAVSVILTYHNIQTNCGANQDLCLVGSEGLSLCSRTDMKRTTRVHILYLLMINLSFAPKDGASFSHFRCAEKFTLSMIISSCAVAKFHLLKSYSEIRISGQLYMIMCVPGVWNWSVTLTSERRFPIQMHKYVLGWWWWRMFCLWSEVLCK
jgi:hypothetical protein